MCATVPVPADAGFHAGELAVQQRAGVRAEAARLSRMVEAGELRGGIAAFLASQTFAVITSGDAAGRLWAAPLAGPAGFLQVTSPDVLTIGVPLPPGSPLHGLPSGQQAGLLVIDFAARRRVRVNGWLTVAGDGTLAVAVQQAYGNCPQYITRRAAPPAGPVAPDAGPARRSAALSAADGRLVRAADTFFLGTSHPGRGRDASHRGGPPGFVRVDGNRLWWPDYPGNNMFNSLGNLAVDPAAALLFLDFGTGRTLQLSGLAKVEWDVAGLLGEDGQTGRRVVFTPQWLVARGTLAGREDPAR